MQANANVSYMLHLTKPFMFQVFETKMKKRKYLSIVSTNVVKVGGLLC